MAELRPRLQPPHAFQLIRTPNTLVLVLVHRENPSTCHSVQCVQGDQLAEHSFAKLRAAPKLAASQPYRADIGPTAPSGLT